MTDFALEVYDAIKKIPDGKVLSYGHLAELAGRPNAARAVGNILHKNPWPKDVPCYKIVHSDGSLAPAFAFGGINRQRELLIADGIMVINNKIDMSQFEWDMT
jgi:O-6-methylguanine DNA methyltransferase